MGLDAFVHTRNEPIEDDVDFEAMKGDEQFFHWKNHYALDSWLVNLYNKRCGTGSWNGDLLQLRLGDINQLERALDFGDLAKIPEFGEWAAEYADQDREFIKLARDAIKSGLSLYYFNWY